MRLPSSLTEPMSIGTSREIAGAPSKNDRIVTTRPSTLGPQPTRGADPGGGIGPADASAGGFMAATTALPASFSRAQSIFCSPAMSLTPSSATSRLVTSRVCSAEGGLPPPPDCADARWTNPWADGMPRSVVTLDPPPDWP
jgi:hypothetical protein